MLSSGSAMGNTPANYYIYGEPDGGVHTLNNEDESYLPSSFQGGGGPLSTAAASISSIGGTPRAAVDPLQSIVAVRVSSMMPTNPTNHAQVAAKCIEDIGKAHQPGVAANKFEDRTDANSHKRRLKSIRECSGGLIHDVFQPDLLTRKLDNTDFVRSIPEYCKKVYDSAQAVIEEKEGHERAMDQDLMDFETQVASQLQQKKLQKRLFREALQKDKEKQAELKVQIHAVIAAVQVDTEQIAEIEACIKARFDEIWWE